MKHKHHIIPRHMGGSDDSSNLIELSIEEHAEAHRMLWEQHGKWQDFIAWQGLSKNINSSEIHSEATKSGMKEWWNNLSEEEKKDWKDRCSKRPDGWIPHTGWTYKQTDEAKEAIRQFQKTFVKTDEHKKNISINRKGKAMGEKNSMSNPDNREKQRQACMGRRKMTRPDGTWYWGRP